MSYKHHILKASGKLGQFETVMTEITQLTITEVEKKIKLPEVDIVFADQPDSVISEIGIGGFAPNRNLLYVYLDPGRANFKEIIKKDLPRTLAHELHHCARWQAVGYGETLLEAIISEGLAEHFDIEINQGNPTQWSTALSSDQIQSFLVKAKKSFHDKKYNHSAWFFGSVSENILRWTGYALGYYLVGEYIKKTGLTAAQLISTKAQLFINE